MTPGRPRQSPSPKLLACLPALDGFVRVAELHHYCLPALRSLIAVCLRHHYREKARAAARPSLVELLSQMRGRYADEERTGRSVALMRDAIAMLPEPPPGTLARMGYEMQVERMERAIPVRCWPRVVKRVLKTTDEIVKLGLATHSIIECGLAIEWMPHTGPGRPPSVEAAWMACARLWLREVEIAEILGSDTEHTRRRGQEPFLTTIEDVRPRDEDGLRL